MLLTRLEDFVSRWNYAESNNRLCAKQGGRRATPEEAQTGRGHATLSWVLWVTRCPWMVTGNAGSATTHAMIRPHAFIASPRVLHCTSAVAACKLSKAQRSKCVQIVVWPGFTIAFAQSNDGSGGLF